MSAPDPVDLSAFSGPWPGLDVGNVTGSNGDIVNGQWKANNNANGLAYTRVDGNPGLITQTDVVNGIWEIRKGDGTVLFGRSTAETSGSVTHPFPWLVDWVSKDASVGAVPTFESFLPAPDGLSYPGDIPLRYASFDFDSSESTPNAVSNFVAVTPGSAGNSIRFRQVNPGTNNAVASVAVSGTDITFNLGTGSGGAITTTCNQRNALINTDPAASLLIFASNINVPGYVGDGTAVLSTAHGYVNFAQGSGTPPVAPSALPVTGATTPVAATLSTTGDTASNAKALLTAVIAGRIGNSFRYQQVNPIANNATASVVVSGTEITVNLATGSGGAITTTGTQRNALIAASAAASALIAAANLTSNTGAGITSAFAFASFTGGLGGLAPAPDPLPL